MIKSSRKQSSTAFFASPYQFMAGSGLGGPIFSAARKTGLNYIKQEAMTENLGFPGSSTLLFNKSIRRSRIKHTFN